MPRRICGQWPRRLKITVVPDLYICGRCQVVSFLSPNDSLTTVWPRLTIVWPPLRSLHHCLTRPYLSQFYPDKFSVSPWWCLTMFKKNAWHLSLRRVYMLTIQRIHGKGARKMRETKALVYAGISSSSLSSGVSSSCGGSGCHCRSRNVYPMNRENN